jgi:hypothetical protein
VSARVSRARARAARRQRAGSGGGGSIGRRRLAAGGRARRLQAGAPPPGAGRAAVVTGVLRRGLLACACSDAGVGTFMCDKPLVSPSLLRLPFLLRTHNAAVLLRAGQGPRRLHRGLSQLPTAGSCQPGNAFGAEKKDKCEASYTWFVPRQLPSQTAAHSSTDHCIVLSRTTDSATTREAPALRHRAEWEQLTPPHGKH